MEIETPLHPEARHKHKTDRRIKLYGDDASNGYHTFTGHQCACGEVFLIEPD